MLTPSHQSVLQALLDQHRAGELPALHAFQLTDARDLLTRIVTDHDAYQDYRVLVSELLTPSAQGADARVDFWYETACMEVVDGGAAAADGPFLARLLLDPRGVLEILMAVEQEVPPVWLPLLHSAGVAALQSVGLPIPRFLPRRTRCITTPERVRSRALSESNCGKTG